MPHQDVPVQPAGRASEWSFEWRGLLTVLLLTVVTLIGWRWLGAGWSSSDELSNVGHAAATTTEPIVATTAVASTSSTTSTTVATTTTMARAAATDPKVNITGEMKPCRFGDNCLVASFTIEGFDEPSGAFTCIYPNSSRGFSFQDDGKADACLTADAGDTITIEVDGVRSATISEGELGG